jgi:hypothetical protein
MTGAQLKTFCLPVKTLDSWEHTNEAVHWKQLTVTVWRQVTTSFLLLEELSSPACCNIAAAVSPKRGYPELPDLSDNLLLSYNSKLQTECKINIRHDVRRALTAYSWQFRVSKWKNYEELHVMQDGKPHFTFHVRAWIEYLLRGGMGVGDNRIVPT